MEIDDSVTVDQVEVRKEVTKETKTKKAKPKNEVQEDNEVMVNCLRNERIEVRFVPKLGKIDNPKHVMFGGMAEGAIKMYTVPMLQSGQYVNVLTNDEKAYLEEVMGLEYNALSIYKKVDNYWDNFFVRLTKQSIYLDLSNPNDYIKYKVLLANKDYIAPSLQALEDNRRATYQFVLVQEGEETSKANKNMSYTMQCYMEFGKVQDNFDVLRTLVELLEGKPVAKTTKIDFLKERINKLIQADAKIFLKVIQDPMLYTKVTIKKAIEAGVISTRGGMLYLKSDGTPLCEDNEEPTLNIAAKFLNNPKRQDLKFSIEAKIKE